MKKHCISCGCEKLLYYFQEMQWLNH